MSTPTPDRPDLTREEEEFVRKLAGTYVAPELSPQERIAFHARLEERIGRRHRFEHWRPVFAGAAIAAALAVLVFARSGTVSPPPGPAAVNVASTTAENVILALATGAPEGQEKELPEDYLAIADVFLGN
jgi:hypothetical protein